ncbi:hypothetical protein LIER_42248 [Lithospermum erythrorhizon]|uniref:Integrase catalytic domain-containing protein n=1 Tax=Lithospermum erythrorhizon TaxID=34254 RepID=A0AAV3RLH3_LITER
MANCIHYLMGKQHRGSFNKSSQRKECQLDLVYFDVCGPMKIKTLCGSSYFVTFIDDYSRKVWAYAMKTKDQVSDIFKMFHLMVERQIGKPLKCIRQTMVMNTLKLLINIARLME